MDFDLRYLRVVQTHLGKSRIRHRMTPNFESRHLQSILKDDFIQIESRSMSDPLLSDIDFKNKMASVWTSFKYLYIAKG